MVSKRSARLDVGKNGKDEADEQARVEISRMISELNEVRMRLDAVIRKLACGEENSARRSPAFENAETLRVQLAGQLDRIRQKLLARMPGEL